MARLAWSGEAVLQHVTALRSETSTLQEASRVWLVELVVHPFAAIVNFVRSILRFILLICWGSYVKEVFKINL